MRTLIASLSILLLTGCSMNEPTAPSALAEPVQATLPSGIQGEILLNVLTNQDKGYNFLRPGTRANELTITPYIEDGDTLLYIVEDGKGWQIFSAKYSSPMILFTCKDKSSFNLVDPNMPDPLREMILSTAENIKLTALSYPDSIHPSWGWKNISADDIANGLIIDKRKQTTNSAQPAAIPSWSPLPDEKGEWVLIETEIVGDDDYYSNKLITTKWAQRNPWNEFCEKKIDNEGIFTIPVGCAPVAVAQYEYYTHFKDGVPAYTVDTAVPDATGMKYVFSGNSSEVWNNMGNGYTYTQPTGIFLAYTAQQLGSRYTGTGTATDFANYENYLKKVYGTTFSRVTTKDFSLVRSTISKKYPLIVYGNGETAAHLFLIDQYHQRRIQTKYTYGWTGNDINGDDPHARDEDGNIIDYGIVNIIYKNSTVDEVSMNWGWGGWYDSVFCNFQSSWTAGGSTYSTTYIYKRNDLQ